MLLITNEWIDIIDINGKIAIRRTNGDKGTYDIIDNELKINWEKWGLETFEKKKNIYYNCNNGNNNIFEIKLESKYYNGIYIFDINTEEVKYQNNFIGKYFFKENNLYIIWKNKGLEIFKQLYYGKIFTSTSFGKIIQDTKKKEIKIIAIVFPQFHEIPENNKFWGNGFTEWTLLKKIPRIVNNEIIKQPHEDIGYFNLNNYEHRKYMRILANKFNIYGF